MSTIDTSDDILAVHKRQLIDDEDAPTGHYSMDEAIRREWLNDHGWIPHDGGECPVPPDTFVQVDLGYVTLGPDRAFKFNWRTVPEYRVIPGEDLLSFGYGEEDDDEPPLVGHNSPNDHYRQGDIECIDAIRAALTDEEWRGFCKGNVLKYTWREKHKGGDGSLLKAQDYLRWALAGKAEDKR
jgi:hypothetical protein